MSSKLIQHLKNKSEDNRHLKLLRSQWEFDEELIPKALQNISSLFPNYSRHDASHSQQILMNIERLLGDRIEYLTATDTWLLLEAAYWHDIGMVVTAKDIAIDIKSDEFKRYVNEIASTKGHELQDFASTFISLDPQNCFSAAETPQQAVENYRNILAGWYRKRHSNRITNIVESPLQETGITSPRNELLPKRLFRILGMICQSHGNNVEKIIEELPF